MNKIPLNRLFTYIVALGLLPSIFVIINYIQNEQKIHAVETHLTFIKNQIHSKQKRQNINKLIQNKYKHSEKFFIDHNIATLSFLNDEIEALHKIIEEQPFIDPRIANKRLKELTGNYNKLLFHEDQRVEFLNIKETVELQDKPVEINTPDLKKLLYIIDPFYGKQEGQPQLIISDFLLEKRERNNNSETFSLSMKLITREYQ